MGYIMNGDVGYIMNGDEGYTRVWSFFLSQQKKVPFFHTFILN